MLSTTFPVQIILLETAIEKLHKVISGYDTINQKKFNGVCDAVYNENEFGRECWLCSDLRWALNQIYVNKFKTNGDIVYPIGGTKEWEKCEFFGNRFDNIRRLHYAIWMRHAFIQIHTKYKNNTDGLFNGKMILCYDELIDIFRGDLKCY